MADAAPDDPESGAPEPRRALRAAQLLLAVAALALWVASRLPWVVVGSFDHLSPPRTTTLSGGTWSTALVPLAVLLLAAAVAGLAVRGWPLRLLAVLVAIVSAATAYLAITLWVVPDVAPRAVELAQIPVTSLQTAERSYTGAVLTLVAAVLALGGAVLLMRVAKRGGVTAGRYTRSTARRSAAAQEEPTGEQSERSLWDALDDGVDPTDGAADSSSPRASEPDTEGR